MCPNDILMTMSFVSEGFLPCCLVAFLSKVSTLLEGIAFADEYFKKAWIPLVLVICRYPLSLELDRLEPCLSLSFHSSKDLQCIQWERLSYTM